MIPRRALIALLALATVTLAGCGGTDRAGANAPRSFFGIAPQTTPSSVDFARMAQGKVGSYHVLVLWRSIERAPGRYDWSRLDGVMRQLALHEIEPIPYVFGTPDHLAASSRVPPVRKASARQAWEAFLREAANRYGPGGEFWVRFALTNPGVEPRPITVWEIWNEPNALPFWHPKPNVGEYAKLIKSSARALRKADPDAEIMVGGMFATPRARASITSFKFLRKLFGQRGMTRMIDVVGIHPYGPDVKDVRRQIVRTRKVMRAAKAGKLDLFVTEIGWGSDPKVRSQLSKSPKHQANMLRKSFRMMVDNRGRWRLRGALWYTWRDPGGPLDECLWCGSAGLFDFDFDPKPAWAAFTKFTGGKR
jgi:polysaccharide biosynthesis protein PslG